MRPPDIVLASASTARTRMLENAGVHHRCDPADIDETAIKQSWLGSAPELAQKLAFEKARTVSLRHRGALVIGSDQILALDNEIFDKPGSVEAAGEQLRRLRGHTHRLISAVSVVCDDQELWTYSDHADLTVRDFSDDFLQDYLDRVSADVTSSVGAYHLEGLGAQLFQSIEGDYFTVLGMPLIALLNFLRHKGALTL